MKHIFYAFLAITIAAVCSAQQTYVVTIETLVNGNSEDKFSFEMQEKEAQKKGFDAKMLAKRYRGKGFPHRVLEADAAEKRAAKKLSSQIRAEKRKTPMQQAEEKLSALRNRMYSLRDSISNDNFAYEKISAQFSLLEEIVNKGSRGAASFEDDFKRYLDEYDPPKKIDEEYESMLRQIPQNTGDIEELEWGSYCNFKIISVAGAVASVDMDFAYSSILTWMYAEGNNNDDTITKHPIFERYEMLGLKDVKIPLNKPYCFQFKRQSNEDARTLQDALAASAIFGGRDPSFETDVKKDEKNAEPKQTFESSGLYSEIRKDDARGIGSVRVVITIRRSSRK